MERDGDGDFGGGGKKDKSKDKGKGNGESNRLSHLDADGKARMVDVSEKTTTERRAVARGFVTLSAEALRIVREGTNSKGNVVEVARLAGVMAAKRTSELIPLCHPLSLDHVVVEIELDDARGGMAVESRVRCRGRTGVEMEALTAVSVAALTIYDMVKAVDKTMVISDIRLIEKDGGRSGRYVRNE